MNFQTEDIAICKVTGEKPLGVTTTLIRYSQESSGIKFICTCHNEPIGLQTPGGPLEWLPTEGVEFKEVKD